MAHDAFISYAHQDKPVADAVCARLEAKGIRCWIAPRDVLPGSEWSAAILDGISESRLLVLIYSASANESGQVRREVERAVSKGIALLPFRIEDVPLSKSLEYFMSTPHWLDALSEPLEHHIEQLAQTVTILLARIDAAADLAPPSRADPSMTMPQPMASVGDPVGARTMQAPPQASDVAPARRVPRGGGASRKLVGAAVLAGLVGVVLLVGLLARRDGGLAVDFPGGRVSLGGDSSGASASGDPEPVSPPWCPGSLGFGETMACSIDNPGQIVPVAFAASANDRVLIRSTETSGPLVTTISVLDARAQPVCSAVTSGELECQLGAASGLYSLALADSTQQRTGDFYLYLQRLNNPTGCQPLGLAGASVTGAIDGFLQANCYTITVQGGERLRLQVAKLSGDVVPTAAVYAPSGTLACGPALRDAVECALPDPGRYTVLVGDGPRARARLGKYQLTLACADGIESCGPPPPSAPPQP